MKFSIAVLITCHNRKEKTLQCLQALFSQKGLSESYLIDVFLVDDGCSDRTSEAVMQDFPQVNIIKGNGELYWNRGMHLAWETAAASKDFDYYLWLNDDTFLFQNGLLILFKENFSTSIVCGTTRSSTIVKATYGGFLTKNFKLLTPNGSYQNADYSNGNCVLIPRYVFEKLGNLDPIFQHALGDIDYTLRSRKKGIDIKLAPEFIGLCESHDNIPKWRSNSLNVINRLKSLYTPLSGCNPPEFFVFQKRHNGIFIAIKCVFSVHVRCLFPHLFN